VYKSAVNGRAEKPRSSEKGSIEDGIFKGRDDPYCGILERIGNEKVNAIRDYSQVGSEILCGER
jgi:hypothetical protein